MPIDDEDIAADSAYLSNDKRTRALKQASREAREKDALPCFRSAPAQHQHAYQDFNLAAQIEQIRKSPELAVSAIIADKYAAKLA